MKGIACTFIIANIFFILFSANSQDIHYSQYNNTSSSINPAFNGLFIGDWRGGLIYRNQWRSADKPFETYMGFADKRWEWVYDIFTMSLMVSDDMSADRKLNQAEVSLTLSYSRKINNQSLSIGFTPSFNQISIGNSISYPDQFDLDNFEFNSNLNTNEPLTRRNERFFALNLGGLWNLRSEQLSAFMGLSVSYINSPTVSFYDENTMAFLPMKTILHGGIAFGIGNKFAVHPSFIFSSQNKSAELIFGSWIEWIISNKDLIRGVRTGIYYRNNNKGFNETGYFNHSDALIIPFSVAINNSRLTFSYDINISSFEAASNNRGAFELSVVYIKPQKKNRNYLTPCWMF